MDLSRLSIELLSRRIGELEKLVSNFPVRLLPPCEWSMRMVRITNPFTGSTGSIGEGNFQKKTAGGFYTVITIDGTADSAGADANAGNTLTMPEGMHVGSTDNQDILLNLAEDTLNSHQLGNGTYHFAVKIGVYVKPGNGILNTQVNDVLACDIATGPVPLKLLDVAGAGRYKSVLGVGSAVNVDPASDYHPPDPTLTFAATFDSYFVNEFEGGSAAAGTNALATEAQANGDGAIVWGQFRGQTILVGGKKYPVYYGCRAPCGTHFEVKLAVYAGMDGPPNIVYTVTTLTGLTLATNVQPTFRQGWKNLLPATTGTGYFDQTGKFVLKYADEAFNPFITCGG